MTGTIGTPIFRFDYTLYDDDFADAEYLKDALEECEEYCKQHCKKYCFQAEKCPSTGNIHIQMRFSLKKKARRPPFIDFVGHYSPTNANITNSNFYDYCSKDESKISKCYRDDEKVIYIPRQIREIKELYKWQQQIIDSIKFDTRNINWLYCESGNIGKSTLVGWCRAYELARCLPMCNDYKELLGMVCDFPTSECYMFDFPRAMKKDRLRQFYGAVENIKDGYAYDPRYKAKEKYFDCPTIWIYSNTLPDWFMLSQDRWKVWTVKEGTLTPYDYTTKGLDKGVLSSDDESF